MLRFSTDPEVAEQQMQAIIFYLTTFGYIDGDFDDTEKEYVREYIRKLVRQRVKTGMPDADEATRKELVDRFTVHFHEVFEGIDRNVHELFTEAVARDEDQDAFIHAKLKLRCFEIFQGFDRVNQELLLEAMDELIEADGEVHPAEVKFRNELVDLFESDLGVDLVEDAGIGPRVSITQAVRVAPKDATHPFFDQFEIHYSAEKDVLLQQVNADLRLIQEAIDRIAEQRSRGAGKLDGKATVADLASEEPFLDGHVYVHPAAPGARYDLTVLGDLHGCYSCLKGAVMQAEFFEKVKAYRADPTTVPKPLLILLGDYIDRGIFSMNGVLRSVMQLFVSAPEHVYVLRGNHEYYVEYKGQIYGGVKPAEAINTLKPHVPVEVFQQYMQLFDTMPNMLLFGNVLFVHAGIPRDRLVKERWKDLSTLNDWDIRFQMMWSDPSTVDVIPAALQDQSARFPFGRLQAAAFLKRIGCHTLIRGHEKVDAGFLMNFDDENVTLGTLFSAGGADNDDLPPESSYRTVTPKALTVSCNDGALDLAAWEIDYKTYNDPERNGFYRAKRELEHRG